MAREMWVVGRVKSYGWDFQGVYTKKSKAVHFCLDAGYFVAPVRLNQALPHEMVAWPGIEFPLKEYNANI